MAETAVAAELAVFGGDSGWVLGELGQQRDQIVFDRSAFTPGSQTPASVTVPYHVLAPKPCRLSP